jgi:drug/metabolite transporter (DMT)-like permease
VALVLVTVWLTFGSAFIGVKVGVATVPPLLFAGPRFMIAGALLLGWTLVRRRGRLDLRLRDLAAAAAVGAGLILGGQGAASWASQGLPAGIVAVLVATVPLWVSLLAWVGLKQRPSLITAGGLVAGFSGVVFLASPSGGAGVQLVPALVATVGAFSWAAATLFGSRAEIARRPVLAIALQMLMGGALQVLVGLITGEGAGLRVAQVEAALPAFVYLLVVPALIGFPAFAWLLAHTPPQVANTQAYAGPVVTLVLGWLLLQEPIGPRTLVAVTVILAGVALIVAGGRRRPTEKELVPLPEGEVRVA